MSFVSRVSNTLRSLASQAHRGLPVRRVAPAPPGLLGFVMMAKNEAKSIEKTIASVRPYVDCWLLLDTGSTDGTQRLAQKAFAGIPGRVVSEPFVDFGTSRSRALDLFDAMTDGQCVFSLMLSGDETLAAGASLRAFCEAEREGTDGGYNMIVEVGQLVFRSTRLARASAGWRYVGAVHEALIPPSAFATRVVTDLVVRDVPSARVVHDEAAHDTTPERLLRDKELLERDIRSGKATANTWFYYGRTLDGLGDARGALTAFDKRLAMPGHPEETFLAAIRSAAVLIKLGFFYDGVQRYLRARQYFPTRAEPVYALARACADRGLWDKAHPYAALAASLPTPTESLLLDRALYAWKRHALLSVTAAHVGDEKTRSWALSHALHHAPADVHPALSTLAALPDA